MNTLDALQARHSVRGYTDQPVEEEKLKTILKYANKAPKSGEFKMTVVRRKGFLDSLDENLINYLAEHGDPYMQKTVATPGYKALYGAPCMVVFSVPEENPGNSGISCDCAAENMCIAATELGLGSCYMMTPMMASVINPMFKDIIMVPKGFEPYCAVLLGYEGAQIIPPQPWVEDYANVNYYD